MRENTFKSQVLEFVAANKGLKRKEYLAAFTAMGLSHNAASLYHYLYVTKVNRLAKIQADLEAAKAKMNLPARDAKGRFIKRVA